MQLCLAGMRVSAQGDSGCHSLYVKSSLYYGFSFTSLLVLYADIDGFLIEIWTTISFASLDEMVLLETSLFFL